MHCIRKLSDDLIWIGASEHRAARFENHYPVPEGMSYNSYVLLDEKAVLFDTADSAVAEIFFENLDQALAGRALDYVVVSHMEPDHAALLFEVANRYPGATFVLSAMALNMMKQFFPTDLAGRAKLVKDGDSLSTGRHTLQFFTAQMVHWPEVIVTYDAASQTLFSADAFGSFGALDGRLLSEEVADWGHYWAEARRYYTNIVGKYGPQVQALLKKAATLTIAQVCPLHGVVLRGDSIAQFVAKYDAWSRYAPEENGVLIAYASVYGHTEAAVQILATQLLERGIPTTVMDAASLHPSYILSEAFRVSHIVLAATTYNNGLFPVMEALAQEIVAHNLQNRTFGIIENGSWAPVAGKLLRENVQKIANTQFLANGVTIKSALKEAQKEQLAAMADEIAVALSAGGKA